MSARVWGIGIIIMAVLVLPLVSVFAVAGQETAKAENAKWTFMVYMAADNDLDEVGIAAFNEMAEVGSDTNVNIVVQFDRRTGGDWTTCKRFYVEEGMAPTAENAIADIGECNMGDPDTLVDFADWATTNYPAEKYALVLRNHGQTWNGCCYDEHIPAAGYDILKLDELQTAFKAISNIETMDLLGFDDCLMSTVEVAYEIRDYGSVMVGSQDLQWKEGWPYNTTLQNLSDNPTWDATSLGTAIVDRFYDRYNPPPLFRWSTQTAFNLSRISTLASSINTLSNVISDDWETKPGNVKDAARSVMEEIGNSIIHEKNWFPIYQGRIHGISAYLPLDGPDPDYSDTNINFTEDTYWDEFLGELDDPPMNDSWIYYAAETTVRETDFEGADLYEFAEKLANYPFGVFAVGSGGTILHYNGSAWSPMDSGTSKGLWDIWGDSPADVFAVGTDGTIVRYNGNSWSEMTSSTTDTLLSVWGNSSTDVFAAGLWGIQYYDGSAWSENYSSTDIFWDVWGTSATNVYAVGVVQSGDGIILQFDGTAWNEVDDGTDVGLGSVWGTSSSDVFVGGDKGLLLHYNGIGWENMSFDTDCDITDIWGSPYSDVYAVGADVTTGEGIILYYHPQVYSDFGIGWTEIYSTTDELFGLWGASRADVFVVGENGSILRSEQPILGTWNSMDSGVTATLTGIWGTTAPPPYAYNFVGMNNPSSTHFAEDGEYDPLGAQNALDGEPFDPQQMKLMNELSSAEYDDVEADDTSRHTTADPGQGDNAWYRFKFEVSESVEDIVLITPTWIGYANVDDSTNYIELCIYNTSTATWQQIDNGHGTTDQTLTAHITSNIDDYIDSNGDLWIAVANRDTSETLTTNYIEAVVTSK